MTNIKRAQPNSYRAEDVLPTGMMTKVIDALGNLMHEGNCFQKRVETKFAKQLDTGIAGSVPCIIIERCLDDLPLWEFAHNSHQLVRVERHGNMLGSLRVFRTNTGFETMYSSFS